MGLVGLTVPQKALVPIHFHLCSLEQSFLLLISICYHFDLIKSFDKTNYWSDQELGIQERRRTQKPVEHQKWSFLWK